MNDITPRRPKIIAKHQYPQHHSLSRRPQKTRLSNPDTSHSVNASVQHQEFAAKLKHFTEHTHDKKMPKYKKILRGITIKRTIVSLIIFIIIIVGWVGISFVYNAHRVFGGNILGILSSTTLKGESTGRVNILLAGNSSDDPGHQGAELTDSIMVLSINTKNDTAFLLSVPRDLWVSIPGSGQDKINDAYVIGQNNNFNVSGYFSGGMGQLQQVIHKDLGITLDYYALVDYSAFRDAVNAVGGIQIDIQSSDPRGIYDPSIDYSTHKPLVKLSNGIHELDGQQALDLARARGDAYGSYGFPNSDFDRTEHQRQMIVALKQKAVSVGVLSNPATLSNLANAIGSNVKTDFTLSEVHRLYDLVKPISSDNIKSLSLNDADGVALVQNYTAPDGEDALAPSDGSNDFSSIQAFVKQQLSNTPMSKEGATVDVLNATDIDGLAAKEDMHLSSEGLFVTQIGDANANQSDTTIIDNSMGKMPLTKRYLINQFGNNVETVNPYGGQYDGDFIVILGTNQTSTGK